MLNTRRIHRLFLICAAALALGLLAMAGTLSAADSASPLPFQVAVPPGVSVFAVTTSTREITVVVRLADQSSIDSINADELTLGVIYSLRGQPFTIFHVLALDPDDPHAPPRPLNAFTPARPRESKPGSGAAMAPISPDGARAPAAGPVYALAGKSIYLSAGHGWYYYATSDWLTQRFLYNGLIEDFNNAEVVNQYLIPYLRQAGADVYPVRDPAMITAELIVDNSDARYAESGLWTTSSLTGYHGSTYRFTASVADLTATATATWSAEVTVSGWYPVYAWYLPGANRVAQAHYRIEHTGGASEVVVNQQVHGATWRYLGVFYFRAGDTARVALSNLSNLAGSAVIADAVRLGGGMGDVDPGGGASGKPRWEEGARYWAIYQGAPLSVHTVYTAGPEANNDVLSRPRYADWENEGTGDDAIYLSWHSNGWNGSARGSVSYVYDNDPDPPWNQWTRITGSLELQSAVHDRVLSAIRAGVDANWHDFGKYQANLGEVREARTMPSMLLELAFHDNVTDAAQLREPRFEQLAARAMYQGIVDYYAQKDGVPARYLPEPPQWFAMRNLGDGQLALSWQPPPTYAFGTATDPAQRYRVYLGDDGFAWDGGREVTTTSAIVSGFADGQVVYARVTAVNAGGESFPSPVLAARVGSGARVLIVQGFDSLDASMRLSQTVGSSSGVTRMWIDQMNRGNYIVQHAPAISLPFDSAVHQVVDAGALLLSSYDVVDWFAGGQTARDGALMANERQALRAFTAQPGRTLLLSGAHVAASLTYGDPAFLADILGSAWLADLTATTWLTPVVGGPFDGLPAMQVDDGSRGTYDARASDVIAARPCVSAGLNYDAAGGAGAVVSQFINHSAAIFLSFPFETIHSDTVRSALMARAMTLSGGWLPCSPRVFYLPQVWR